MNKSSVPNSCLVTCLYIVLSTVAIDAFTSYGQCSWNRLLLGKPDTAVIRNKLNYRHEDSIDGQVRIQEHVNAVDSMSSKSRSNRNNISGSDRTCDMSSEDQCYLDDYLKFLNRRYHRLHDAEDKNRNNALYVLGVAKLASQRLLQQSFKTDVIDIPTTKVNISDTSTGEDKKVLPNVRRLSAGTSVIRRINYRAIFQLFVRKFLFFLNRIIRFVQSAKYSKFLSVFSLVVMVAFVPFR